MVIRVARSPCYFSRHNGNLLCCILVPVPIGGNGGGGGEWPTHWHCTGMLTSLPAKSGSAVMDALGFGLPVFTECDASALAWSWGPQSSHTNGFWGLAAMAQQVWQSSSQVLLQVPPPSETRWMATQEQASSSLTLKSWILSQRRSVCLLSLTAGDNFFVFGLVSSSNPHRPSFLFMCRCLYVSVCWI